MARFNVAARRVVRTDLNPAVRFLALLWAIDSYTSLTGETFDHTYRRLGSHFGFTWSEKPDGAQMTQAVAVLAQERLLFISRLEAFSTRRRLEKASGRRQSSRSQLRDLYFEPWFVVAGPMNKSAHYQTWLKSGPSSST